LRFAAHSIASSNIPDYQVPNTRLSCAPSLLLEKRVDLHGTRGWFLFFFCPIPTALFSLVFQFHYIAG
jgi:hypothetical protein